MNIKQASPQTIAGIKDIPTYETVRQLRDALNTILGDFASEWTVTTPATPNTDFNIIHNLNRVVSSWLVTSKSAACDLYLGTPNVSDPNNILTLRATVGSVTVKLVLM